MTPRKPTVLSLIAEIGFEAVDTGPLRVARLLEPYGMLWIDQALKRGRGYRFRLRPPQRLIRAPATG
jgi:8-hydroxy-5-deazaflavin:NADPH oxidoreductase